MSYIKKDIRNLIINMDNKFKVDSAVKKWLEKTIYPKHNLIIKLNNSIDYCTNCHHKFSSNKNINDYQICPKCKEELLIRFKTLKKYKFIDTFRILDYINGYFVLRGFEVMSYYDNFKFKHRITEYQRLIIDKDKFYLLFSNCYKNYLGSIWVNHYEKHERWRLYDNRYSSWYYCNGIVYFGDIDKDIKNTPYQYCNLTSLIPISNGRDFINILQKILTNPFSYELLNKLKLTNLAIECDKFNIKGSFEKRFGVAKTYLPFMIKHNITYDELKVLRVIKKKNIKIIRKLSCLSCFDELSDKLDMLKALEVGLNKDNEYIYRDYLNFVEQLKLNIKDKNILYPNNLIESHDKLLKQVKDIKDKEMIENIEKRFIELKDNTYKDDKYIVYPASSYTDLLMESNMQNNCVRTYNFRYANREVDLYFMRLLSNINKSLVTIEVKNNVVVQCRIKNNKLPSKEQKLFIDKWQNTVLNPS